MRLARSLNLAEVLVFGAIARRNLTDPVRLNITEEIAFQSGLEFHHLVVEAKRSLGLKGLVQDRRDVEVRIYADRFDRDLSGNYVQQRVGEIWCLSDLGKRFFGFVNGPSDRAG